MPTRQHQAKLGAEMPPPTAKGPKSAAPGQALSHNLLGQRLGKKGRDTRERILAATDRLLADPRSMPISLSAVAREASLGMTTLYLYFSDLTELLLAALEPIMASGEQAYVAHMRTRWPDDALGGHCATFVTAFHAFWEKHSRILHLRNSYAANLDKRMVRHRIASAQPMISLLIRQMDGDPDDYQSPASGMATVLLTGVERMVTVATDVDMPYALADAPPPRIPNLMRAQARLLELGIREGREAAAKGAIRTRVGDAQLG